MKRDKKIYIIIGIVILVMLGIILLASYFIFQKDKKVIVKDNVVIITEETKETDKPYLIEESGLLFKKHPNYSVGDVIVSGVTEEAPYGYIRKVISIKEIDTEYYCSTESATLLDVFEEAHIRETIELTTDMDMLSKLSKEKQLAYSGENLGGIIASSLLSNTENRDNEDMKDLLYLTYEENDEEIGRVECEVGIKIWLDFVLDVEDEELEWGMSANARIHGDMLFGFSDSQEKEYEKELLRKILPTITIWAGPVPIVVTNQVSCQLEAEKILTGSIDSSINADSTITAGFLYTSSDNKVQEITEEVKQTGGMKWDSSVGVEGKANAGVFVYLTTLLYDSTGAHIGIGLEGQVDGAIKNGFVDGFEGELNLAIYPQIKGYIVVEIPVISEDLVGIPIFEKSLKPLWEAHFPEKETEKEDVSIEDIDLEDGSKISFLLFEPGWECIDHAEEISSKEWWDERIQSGKHFREQSAINDLNGNVDTSWILENYVFSDKIYQDGDDIEGLTVTYMEISDVKSSNSIDCVLKVDPFSRWRTAFMNIYVDEQFVATIEIPGEIKIMNDYIWNVAKIEKGKLKIINECKMISEYNIETSENDEDENSKEGHINGVLMVAGYQTCKLLHTSTIKDELHYEGKRNDEKYVLVGGKIISPILYLYKNNEKIATVSVADYNCKYVDDMNIPYFEKDMFYEEKFEWIGDVCYTYMLSEQGKVAPVVRGKIDFGTMCLYPIIEFDENITENEMKNILKGLSWSYDY